jgi:WD40 repeat protein/energy-coupling factor transporter ATP-binding protein EcfA2
MTLEAKLDVKAEPDVKAVRASGPYKGLTYFTEADSAFFFGRETERDLVLASLKASRLTLVYGPSGAGKSSLLRAGVAASLRETARRDFERFGSAEFVPVVFSNWRDDPVTALARSISESVGEFTTPSGDIGNGLPPAGAPGDLVGLIGAAAARTQASLLLIFDQFEEYFLYHGSEQGPLSFSEQFAAAVGAEGLAAGFLVAMREDALAQLDHFRGRIPNLFSSYRRVNPLGKAAARQAISRPVEEYNRQLSTEEQVSIGPDLVSTVVDQVSAGKVRLETVGAGALEGKGDDAVEAPYLQLVMTRIWQEEVALGSRHLRLSTLQSLGGAQRIVRSHLDATLGSLGPDDQDVAADVFHQLVTPSGTKIAHSVSDLADYTRQPEERISSVLNRMGEGDTRIVRFVPPPLGSDGPPRYEIFHDVLAPAVLDWRGRHSARRLEAEKDAAEQRTRVQRRRTAAAVVTAVVAIALLATVVIGNAVSQRDANRSRVLAADAVANLATDPELSTLLALSAIRTSPTAQAVGALREAFPAVSELRTMDLGRSVSATVFSPNGQQVAAASADDGVVRIWSLGRRTGPVKRSTDFAYVNGLAFSPDGRYLAVAGSVRSSWRSARWPGVEVLSTAGTAPATPLYVPGQGGDIQPAGQAVAWQGPVDGPDHLVTVDSNGYLCEYRQAGPAPGHCTQTGFASLDALSLDKAGTRAAIAGGTGATVWSVPNFKKIFPPTNNVWGVGNVQSVALSNDGRELVTTSVEGITLVTGLYGDYPQLGQFSAGGEVEDAVFSPDGSRIATTTDLGQTTVWQLEQASQLGGIDVAQLNCDCGVVYAADFDPANPNLLVTGSEDGMVRLWATSPRQLLASYQVTQSFPWSSATDGVGELTYVPDLGDLVAITSGVTAADALSPDRAVVVNLRSGQQVSTNGGPAADVQSITASQPDRDAQGATVVAVVTEGDQELVDQVVSWHLANDAAGGPVLRQVQLKLPHQWPGAPQEVAISPNGKWLAVSFSGTDLVELVDLSDGHTFGLPRTAGYAFYRTGISFNNSATKVIASFNDGVAFTWSVPGGPSGPPPRFLRAYTDPDRDAVLWDAQFSPDGKLVVLADNAGKIAVFSTSTGTVVAELNAGAGQVNTAEFSPDSTEVATAGDDGTVRIWDLAGRDQLAEFGPTDQPLPTAVNAAIFATLDGAPVVIAASNDGYVRAWSVEAALSSLAGLEKAAQARVTRGYTPAERSEYLTN